MLILLSESPLKTSKLWSSIYSTRALATAIPRTEFPTLSSLGDQTDIPPKLGTTIKMQPPTPDLAGTPTSKAH